MSRQEQAISDIKFLEKRGLIDALFKKYIHHDGNSIQSFLHYCESDPSRHFKDGNVGNCERLRYAQRHWDEAEPEEVLKSALKAHPM